MPRRSAGVIAVRRAPGAPLQVLLAHPGGPLWARRDDGAWSIPKGEYTDEDPRDAAAREFAEEVGVLVDPAELAPIGEITQKSGKVVTAFVIEVDVDPGTSVSNTFEMEWPRGSGRRQTFPEVDRVEWFDLDTAGRKILAAQQPLLARVEDALRPQS
ncbi:MAG: NUDIX domain-containing protein [Gordonia paraffinivorans]